MTINLTIAVVLTVVMAALTLAVLYVLQAKCARRTLVSIVRMAVQLCVVVACAYAVLKADRVWLNLLWLFATTSLAAWYVVLRAGLRRRKMLAAVWGSMLVAVAVGLLPLYSLGAVHRAALLVPAAGIVQAVVASILPRALKEYFVSLVRFSDTYYYLLGNGTSWRKAVQPMVRRAADRSLLPACRRMALAALVGLPPLLGGLLLGGVQPLPALVVVLLLSLSGLFATLLSLLLVVLMSRQIVTDKRGHLSDNARR